MIRQTLYQDPADPVDFVEPKKPELIDHANLVEPLKAQLKLQRSFLSVPKTKTKEKKASFRKYLNDQEYFTTSWRVEEPYL